MTKLWEKNSLQRSAVEYAHRMKTAVLISGRHGGAAPDTCERATALAGKHYGLLLMQAWGSPVSTEQSQEQPYLPALMLQSYNAFLTPE